jgi:uncharacterized Zn finger protein (UPF0148 family)
MNGIVIVSDKETRAIHALEHNECPTCGHRLTIGEELKTEDVPYDERCQIHGDRHMKDGELVCPGCIEDGKLPSIAPWSSLKGYRIKVEEENGDEDNEGHWPVWRRMMRGVHK